MPKRNAVSHNPKSIDIDGPHPSSSGEALSPLPGMDKIRDLDVSHQNGCHLPTELWLDVFGYLRHHDIKTMSCLCKRLRSLALSLMFLHLDLSLRIHNDPFYNTLWYDRRLEVFTSDHIRHVVRKCTIRSGEGLFHTDERMNPNRNPIIIKKYLRRFPNLTALDCFEVVFNKKILKTLQLLPALTSLVLRNCTIDLPGQISPHPYLRLRHLEVLTPHLPGWVFFLHPDHLETLRVSECVLPTRLATQILPRLRVLHLIKFQVPIGYPIMPALPQLEILQYYSKELDSPPPLLFSRLPKLKEFEGPSKLLSSLLREGTTERLILPHASETKDIPAALRGIVPFNPQLQSLRVYVAHISHGLLEVTCSFPALRNLELFKQSRTAEPSPDTIQSAEEFLTKLLALSFAPLIEHIHISNPWNRSDYSGLGEFAEPLLSWVSRYTKLRYLTILGGDIRGPAYQYYGDVRGIGEVDE